MSTEAYTIWDVLVSHEMASFYAVFGLPALIAIAIIFWLTWEARKI